MNFAAVTEKLLQEFNARNIRYALIGGFAIGLWGVSRATVDMDFLVAHDDLAQLDLLMARLGYQLRHRSDNVSHFVAEAGAYDAVDFVHAFRVHALRMLERAVDKPVFGGRLAARLLMPEDLIGLKIQAVANNPARERLDLYDIEELMRLHGTTMDWELLEEYFGIFDREPLFTQLREKFHATD